MRVVVGGISHETSTFTPVQTDLGSYEERFLLRGDDIVRTFTDTNTPIGGFIEGASQYDMEVVPTLFAEPHIQTLLIRAHQRHRYSVKRRNAKGYPNPKKLNDTHVAKKRCQTLDAVKSDLKKLRSPQKILITPIIKK